MFVHRQVRQVLGQLVSRASARACRSRVRPQIASGLDFGFTENSCFQSASEGFIYTRLASRKRTVSKFPRYEIGQLRSVSCLCVVHYYVQRDTIVADLTGRRGALSRHMICLAIDIVAASSRPCPCLDHASLRLSLRSRCVSRRPMKLTSRSCQLLADYG